MKTTGERWSRTRWVMIWLSCLLVGLLAHRTEAAEPVELRLWNIPSKNSTDPIDVARRRVFDQFVKAHPEIRVKALVPLKIQGPAAEGSEFLAVAGGVAPDVFFLYGRKVGDYRDQGFLLPLNAQLQAFKKRTGHAYEGISAPDSVWRPTIDGGKVYAVPLRYYSMALRLRKSSFARAGMVGKAPKNWDELYRFARKLTIDPSKEPGSRPNDPIQFGLWMQEYFNAGWTYHQYVWSAGGEMLVPFLRTAKGLVQVPPPTVDYAALGVQLSNEKAQRIQRDRDQKELEAKGLPKAYGAGDLEWRLVTDRPDAMKALHFWRKLVHQPWMRHRGHEFDLTPAMLTSGQAIDPITKDTFDLRDPKIQNRIYWGVTNSGQQTASPSGIQRSIVAMEISPLEEANNNSPSEFDFVPFPSIDGSPPPAFIAGTYLGINVAIQPESQAGRTDVAAIQDAAWKYIQFVTGPEAQRTLIDTFVEYGIEQMVRPTLLQQAGYGDALARIPANRRALWEGLDQRAKPEPYAKGYTHVMERELSMVLGPILSDRPDPKTGKFARDPQAVMNSVVQHTNTAVLGRLPESEVQRKSGIGALIFAVILIGLGLGTRQIVRFMLRAESTTTNEGFGVGSDKGRRQVMAWGFLLPAVVTIFLWSYWPLGKGLLMAFQEFHIVGESKWVGLRNFIEVVSEPKFWLYFLQTFEYMGLSIGLGFFAPLVLAILLHEVPRGKVLFRILFYLPAVTTGLVTLFLWLGILYDPSNNGLLNQVILGLNSVPEWMATTIKLGSAVGLAALAGYGVLGASLKIGERLTRNVGLAIGLACAVLLAGYLVLNLRDSGSAGLAKALTGPFNIKPQSFLQDPGLAMLWVVVPTIWAGAGPGCLIYLAALKGVPSEQYEAADLDGAGVWEKIMSVTYPNLRGLIAINFVGAVIGGFKESSNIFAMTGGGPEDSTMTIGLHIWYNAFMFLNFGMATAMAWIMGALLVGFTLKQLQILNKLTFRSSAVEAETNGGGA